MDATKRREKFLAKCKVTGDCWLWQGMKSKTGYGQVKRDGKFIFAHRYSYMLHKGELGGLFVLHKCDVRLCVNPDHLSLGTQKDNQQDMRDKGRHCHGEKSPHAKLTEKQVLEIYQMHDEGIGTILIARKFGVTKNLAWLIVRGKAWNHLYQARYGVSDSMRI